MMDTAEGITTKQGTGETGDDGGPYEPSLLELMATAANRVSDVKAELLKRVVTEKQGKAVSHADIEGLDDLVRLIQSDLKALKNNLADLNRGQ